MNQYIVLLVEDDKRLRVTIDEYLTMHGYKVLTAAEGLEAVRIFEEHCASIDIVVLDGMLPDIDGYEVLKKIRKRKKLPVIILSARESEEDQLLGFALGANSYMTKPFMLSVLKAQIHAFLRDAAVDGEIISRGGLSIDTAKRRVCIEGKEIGTTPKEYELLLLLLQNENIVLDRNTILDKVWGLDYYGNDRTVDTIIKQLRKKMTDRCPYIKSVYGVGYFFEVTEDAE